MSRVLGTPENPLRVAVVGSGPSGFYAAEALLGAALTAEVDMLERLPVPYGLVRYGVAPDHAKLKAVTKVFAEIAQHPRFRLFANVALGRDVTAAELGERYHAVIVATGAASDRKLGIEGEQLAGVHAASDFVGWYNGHPDYTGLRFDLSCEVAVVIGQGNVAIDVCRVLAKPVDELRRTDIALHAIEALAESRVREIHLVGRRGPAQAKFTPKELRELGTLRGCQPLVDGQALLLNQASREELADPANAGSVKNLEILRSFAARPHSGDRHLALRFLLAPRVLHGASRLQRITFAVQRLVGGRFEQRSEATGETLELEAGLLFRSVGYCSTAIPGLPFDARRGVIPNCEGRVLSTPSQRLPGWYATGWIKRGPTGVIGTNRQDSVETVERLLQDLPALDLPGKAGRAGLVALLEQRQRHVVGFQDWLRIESLEQQRGAQRNKTAEKFTSITDMLAAAQGVPEFADGYTQA